jgi:hypothetical protein
MTQNSPESPPGIKEAIESMMFVRDRLDEYGLDPYEFRVYAHIVRRTGGKTNKKFFASQSKSAEICQMSVRKFQYSLKFLCKAQMIVQEKRQGRTDVYRLTPPILWVGKEVLPRLRDEILRSRKSTSPEPELRS